MSTCDFHTPLKKTTIRQPKNVVGPAVRRLRLSQRTLVSQQDLAGRLAARGITIDRSAIARIEAGERYVLDYEAAAIAQAFRVPVEQLFGR
jgi:transcriptional regulator with XRE-family HTH domain